MPKPNSISNDEWRLIVARNYQRIQRHIRVNVTYILNGCSLWPGATVQGYPVMSLKTSQGWRTVRISRLVLAMAGKLELGDSAQMALHRCDNPICIVEDHLFAGSQRDNMSDASQKGRIKVPCLAGVDHPASRLTEEDVRDIRRGIASLSQMATRFKLSLSGIKRIRNGRTYAGVL